MSQPNINSNNSNVNFNHFDNNPQNFEAYLNDQANDHNQNNNRSCVYSFSTIMICNVDVETLKLHTSMFDISSDRPCSHSRSYIIYVLSVETFLSRLFRPSRS